MICSRRTFLRFGAAAAVVGSPASAAPAEPVWIVSGDVGEFDILGDEIVTVGSNLRFLDAATGQERRSIRLRKPSDAEGPARLALTSSAIVFGWYVWHEAIHIVCIDPRSLQVRWHRRIVVTEREREGGIPYVFPLVRSEGIFILLSNKHSENLFRLRPESGEIVWSRYIERFAVQDAVAWHGNRLLVRSRVARGENASGDLYAIEPGNGSTVWRLRLEGRDYAGRDTMLISGDRAYIASPVYPGESCRLHIVDLAAGVTVKSFTIERLNEPFAYHEGVVYFGGNMPTAWDVRREQVIWRTNLRERRGELLLISHDPVLDIVRQRIYLGETGDSFFVLSSTDGAVVGAVNVRRGRTSPNIMTVYGAYRLRLVRHLLLVGAGDQQLLAYATASL